MQYKAKYYEFQFFVFYVIKMFSLAWFYKDIAYFKNTDGKKSWEVYVG